MNFRKNWNEGYVATNSINNGFFCFYIFDAYDRHK